MKLLIVVYRVAGVPSWDELIKDRPPMGGSEEAVVNLKDALESKGVDVQIAENTVVENKTLEFDIVLVWRLTCLDRFRGCGKRIFFWSHDYPCVDYFGELRETDVFLCLSRFHYMTWLPVIPSPTTQKKLRIGNGYNPSYPLGDKKSRLSCIYTSSHNRGLWHILTLFDELMKRFPTLTLEIYYDRMDKAKERNSHAGDCTELYREFDRLLSRYPDNFIYHGFLPLDEIEKAYSRSSVFLYPSTYPETFCISLLKAQANGCIPIVRRYGALEETLVPSAKKWSCAETREWRTILIRSLEKIRSMSDEEVDNERKVIASEARDGTTWGDVADRLL